MNRRLLSCALLSPLLVSSLHAREAAPVTILVPLLLQGPMVEMEPLLRARVRTPLKVEYTTMMQVTARLRNGEAADLAFVSKAVADELAAKGRVRSHTDLLQSESGLAIADDAPAPVMKSTEDFVAFLRATPSIAYFAGGSGAIVTQVIEKYALAEMMRPKATVISDGLTSALLRQGKVASAVQSVSELKAGGARNIVLLPESIQVRPVVGLTVLSGAARADAVAEVEKLLESSEAAAIYARFGLRPLFSH
jgi:molybdate transport system substrate-binding protein